jgi:hypothetical protein
VAGPANAAVSAAGPPAASSATARPVTAAAAFTAAAVGGNAIHGLLNKPLQKQVVVYSLGRAHAHKHLAANNTCQPHKQGKQCDSSVPILQRRQRLLNKQYQDCTNHTLLQHQHIRRQKHMKAATSLLCACCASWLQQGCVPTWQALPHGCWHCRLQARLPHHAQHVAQLQPVLTDAHLLHRRTRAGGSSAGGGSGASAATAATGRGVHMGCAQHAGDTAAGPRHVS